jgi:hypothetical protein
MRSEAVAESGRVELMGSRRRSLLGWPFGWYYHDGTGGTAHEFVDNTADSKAGDPAATVGASDNEIDMFAFCPISDNSS